MSTEPNVRLEYLPWGAPEGLSLGRHIRHDERNREARHTLPRRAAPDQDVRHRNWGKKLYQDGIGACTCFTAGHAVNSMPYRTRLRPARTLTDTDCFALYRIASDRDPWEGKWEPDDTGSSGQAACVALVETGRATGYQWAFGYEHGLSVIGEEGLMQGTWWYEGMFNPEPDGRVRPTGRRSGGHEYYWIGTELRYGKRRNWFLNSWHLRERPWGKNGYFYMEEEDHRSLVDEQDGDLVRPTMTT